LCLDSFRDKTGWKPEIFDGCNPKNIGEYESKYDLKTTQRTKHKPGKASPDLITTKKSCFYSHYDLWNRCVDLQQPIAIVEHDTECVLDYNLPDIDSNTKMAIQLTTDSILFNWDYYKTEFNKEKYKTNGSGMHRIFYVHAHGKKYMAGNTGYIITPSACKVLIEDCKENGWLQNDLLIHDDVFPLYYINPSPIRYVKNRELRSSSRIL
jgi:GR25 family glycosyltransferase involved in LPS biosynthesis